MQSETLADDSWDRLAACLESFVEAWQQGQSPPEIEQHLPQGSEELRTMALVELVKVDLEYRLEQGGNMASACRLEWYLSRFPSLSADNGPPADLIFEEFHLRRTSGEGVTLTEYYRRFPHRSKELKQLADLRAGQQTLAAAETQADERLELQLKGEIEGFELLEELGAGAFAKVYLAWQQGVERKVALKVSKQGMHESRMLAQLDHPHIIRVIDQRWLKDRGIRLVYMEYVSGGTLKSVVDKVRETPIPERTGELLLTTVDEAATTHDRHPQNSPLRKNIRHLSWLQTVCRLGVQLSEALQHAHDKGVLHRDVKPANILLDGEGSPKLADFNIAFGREVDGAVPAAYFGGSPAYMSREQLEAFDLDHAGTAADLDERTDIYSLGAVIWELYVGERPYPDLMQAGKWALVLPQLIEQRNEPPPIADALPDALQQVLTKCLAPNPEDRYQSAEHLHRDLQLILSPDIHKLLRPAPKSWVNLVARWPLLALAIAALLPNLILTVPNLIYNLSELLKNMDETAFFFSFTPINIIAWGGSAAICVYALRPMLDGLKTLRQGGTLEAVELSNMMTRCLSVPMHVALVVGLAWFGSGIPFPAVAGSTSLVFLHFLVSQIVHGVIVAGLCYFAVMFITTRALLPRFVVAAIDVDLPPLNIEHAKTHISWFSAILGTAPFLAIGALGMIGAKSLYFIMLAIVGGVSFLVSLGTKPVIHADLERLRQAGQ